MTIRPRLIAALVAASAASPALAQEATPETWTDIAPTTTRAEMRTEAVVALRARHDRPWRRGPGRALSAACDGAAGRRAQAESGVDDKQTPPMSVRPTPHARADYPHFTAISTRWSDNDAYRHVNNVVYYGFFDTAVNQMLIEAGALDVEGSPAVGLVVETQCRYFAPVSFPDRVSVGLRVMHLGRSSIRYELAVFRNDDARAAAQGHFVHVYVDRDSQRPVALPAAVRAAVTPWVRA
jgi:acyl-CoA thioester hydrolase